MTTNEEFWIRFITSSISSLLGFNFSLPMLIQFSKDFHFFNVFQVNRSTWIRAVDCKTDEDPITYFSCLCLIWWWYMIVSKVNKEFTWSKAVIIQLNFMCRSVSTWVSNQFAIQEIVTDLSNVWSKSLLSCIFMCLHVFSFVWAPCCLYVCIYVCVCVLRLGSWETGKIMLWLVYCELQVLNMMWP